MSPSVSLSKIALFKSVFMGREDVFAVRWEKGNKSGYMPAYFYDPYRYRAHKMSGGTFQNYTDKEYLSFTDKEIEKNYKHQLHLKYLADRHERTILKIRFVLNPFSFVFLLAGKEGFHIILETLNTEEATYIWHFDNDKRTFPDKLKQVDHHLNIIRNNGRQAFIENLPENFSRILHDYSDERKGFIIWKDLIEERLI